jgi:hypothetical protein
LYHLPDVAGVIYSVNLKLPSSIKKLLWCVALLMALPTEALVRKYSKTCLKRNTIVPVFFFVFTGFRFTKGCVLIKQSTKNMIA